MNSDTPLNWAKEDEVRELKSPVRAQIDIAFNYVQSLPPGAEREDLYHTVHLLSAMVTKIDTKPFRVHGSNDLPQLEQLIAGILDFVVTRLRSIGVVERPPNGIPNK